MSTENKIVYYFLRISAERFASDLQHFQKEISDLTDEELYAKYPFFQQKLPSKLITNNHSNS